MILKKGSRKWTWSKFPRCSLITMLIDMCKHTVSQAKHTFKVACFVQPTQSVL